MATVDEVLATMEAEPVAPASETEAFCTVNDSRQIIIPDIIKTIGVESDKDVEKIWFDCPSVYDGSNLLEFSFYVNYANANGEGNTYEIPDVTERDGRLRFYWLVSRNVVAYKGDVKFAVCAKKTDASGAVLQEWNTTIATLKVLEGLETSSAPIEENVDILEQWKADLFGLSESGKKTIEDVSAEKLAAINAAGDTATTNINAGIRQIELSAQQGLAGVNGAGTTQVQAVNTAGTTQVDNINTAGSAQKAAVNAAGTAQTANVNAAGAAQVAAVTQEGADQIANIQMEAESYIRREDANKLAFKGQESGRNIHVEDSADWGFLGMQGYGESTQVQTTGAQLIAHPFDESTLTRNGITYTDNGDGSVIVNGTATTDSVTYIKFGKTLEAGTYTLSGCPAGGSANGYSLCFGSSLQADIGEGITRDVNNETFDIYIRVKSGTTVNNAVFRPMLNAGDTALPWEPYTGGAPSPSTDYPQEIVSKCQARQLLNDDNFYDLMLVDKTPVFSNPRILNATDKYGTIKTTIDTPGTYTLSCDSNYYFMANRQYLNGEPVISIGRKLPYTFEVATPGTIAISVERDKSATDTTDIPIGEGKIPSDFRFMINAGKEPGAWAPYGKYGLEYTVRTGQLVDYVNSYDTEYNGIKMKIDRETGVVTFTGSNTAASAVIYHLELTRTVKAGETVYLNAGNNIVNSNVSLRMYNKDTLVGVITDLTAPNKKASYTVPADCNRITVRFAQGATANITLRPILAVSDQDWQPCAAQALRAALDAPLRGIPVSSGGNVTIDGQEYIADYIDWERGKRVQRVIEDVYDGSADEGIANNAGSSGMGGRFSLKSKNTIKSGCGFCNIAKINNYGDSVGKFGTGNYGGTSTMYYIGYSNEAVTVDEFRTFLSTNPLVFYVPLATPIETNIPPEELAAYRRLHAYHGATNIHNSDDVYTALEYARDPDIVEQSITDRLTALETAQAQTAAAFSYLPADVQAVMIENETNHLLQEV